MRFGVREMIFVLVLLALPLGAYLILFEVMIGDTAQLRRENLQKKAKLEELEVATRDINDLGQEIDRLSEAIVLFEEKLPGEREEQVILKEVWELAAKHKLTPKSIRTDKAVTSAQYSELPIRMAINGDFDGYYSFLIDLEKLRRITQLPQMTLKKAGAENQGQMSAEMVLSIFFESQSAQGAGGKTGS